MEPGEGVSRTEFVGLETPPVVKAEEAGKRIVLMAKRLGSIDTGSPLYYKGILAGEVLGYELGNDRESVFIHAFVKSPYDELVRGNTRFWNVSGIDFSMDAGGVDVRTESIHTILLGGISFETPSTLEPAQEDVSGLIFTLYDRHSEIEETSYTQKIHFVAFFDGSVRGLKIDAPVEFKGIKVGSVRDIRLEFDRRTTTFLIPVLIEIEPERIAQKGVEGKVSPYESLTLLVERGLRARLKMGSFLTGQLFVELDLHPGSPMRLIGESGRYPELPTLPASLDEITDSLSEFLAKLKKVPIDTIAADMQEILGAANKTINAPEVLNSLRRLESSLETFQKLTDKMDRSLLPKVDKAMATANTALSQLQATLVSINDSLSPDAPLHYGTIQMIGELSEMARSIRSLVDLLEQNPESFIFGKGGGAQ